MIGSAPDFVTLKKRWYLAQTLDQNFRGALVLGKEQRDLVGIVVDTGSHLHPYATFVPSRDIVAAFPGNEFLTCANDIDTALQEGLIHINAQDYRSATTELTSVVKNSKASQDQMVVALYRLSEVDQALGHWDQCVSDVNAAIGASREGEGEIPHSSSIMLCI